MDPRPPGDVVFVAEVAGHPAGYAAARVDGGVLVVDRVMVAPADRGRHVGHRLLDWLEGYGVSRGLERVRIAVEPENRPAPSSTTAAATRSARARWSATCRICDAQVRGMSVSRRPVLPHSSRSALGKGDGPP